jgi:hypothetical protein
MSLFQSFQGHHGDWIALRTEGVPMHIQRTQMNIAAVNPYAAAAEKAVVAQRAANIRKKLTQYATDLEAVSTSEEAFMVGHPLNAQPDSIQNTALSETEHHPSSSGRVSGFG